MNGEAQDTRSFRKRFYDQLVTDGVKLPDFQKFDQGLNKPEVRRKLYDKMKSDGFAVPEYEKFDTKIASDTAHNQWGNEYAKPLPAYKPTPPKETPAQKQEREQLGEARTYAQEGGTPEEIRVRSLEHEREKTLSNESLQADLGRMDYILDALKKPIRSQEERGRQGEMITEYQGLYARQKDRLDYAENLKKATGIDKEAQRVVGIQRELEQTLGQGFGNVDAEKIKPIAGKKETGFAALGKEAQPPETLAAEATPAEGTTAPLAKLEPGPDLITRILTGVGRPIVEGVTGAAGSIVRLQTTLNPASPQFDARYYLKPTDLIKDIAFEGANFTGRTIEAVIGGIPGMAAVNAVLGALEPTIKEVGDKFGEFRAQEQLKKRRDAGAMTEEQREEFLESEKLRANEDVGKVMNYLVAYKFGMPVLAGAAASDAAVGALDELLSDSSLSDQERAILDELVGNIAFFGSMGAVQKYPRLMESMKRARERKAATDVMLQKRMETLLHKSAAGEQLSEIELRDIQEYNKEIKGREEKGTFRETEPTPAPLEMRTAGELQREAGLQPEAKYGKKPRVTAKPEAEFVVKSLERQVDEAIKEKRSFPIKEIFTPKVAEVVGNDKPLIERLRQLEDRVREANQETIPKERAREKVRAVWEKEPDKAKILKDAGLKIKGFNSDGSISFDDPKSDMSTFQMQPEEITRKALKEKLTKSRADFAKPKKTAEQVVAEQEAAKEPPAAVTPEEQAAKVSEPPIPAEGKVAPELEVKAPKEKPPAEAELKMEEIPKDLSIDVEVISEETGTRAKVKKNARESFERMEKHRDLIKRLRDCVEA